MVIKFTNQSTRIQPGALYKTKFLDGICWEENLAMYKNKYKSSEKYFQVDATTWKGLNKQIMLKLHEFRNLKSSETSL